MENKSKNIIIILLALAVVVLAVFLVLNKDKKEKIVNEEVKGEIVLADLEDKIKTEAPEWSNYWIGEDTGSNLSMFIKYNDWSPLTQIETSYDAGANKLREKNVYIYSPNKTKILDPKGGMELFERDGKIQEAYDVDSSVKLIDLETNKFKQILSCGTPCGFSDAVWIDDNYFVVLGNVRGIMGSECKIYKYCQYPSLYLFDLLNNKYILYSGPERLLELEKEEISTSADTYTYKNHGFTMELPKGYTPKDQQAENGPTYLLTLPNNSYLTYVTNASFWEVNISRYKYLRDEKLGATTFKVYDNDGVTIYYFKQGNVGYEFVGDRGLLNTFKFVGWN